MKIKKSLFAWMMLLISLTIFISGCLTLDSKVPFKHAVETAAFNNVFDAAKRGDVTDIQQFASSINQSRGSWKPIHYACSFQPKKSSLIKYMIDKGADVNAKTNNGWTPLHFMAQRAPGNSEILKLLIDKGADVNAKTRDGWTPLHFMAQSGPENIEIFKLLIDKGADVNAKTRDGKNSPIDLASNETAKNILRERKEQLDRMLPIYVNKGQWHLAITTLLSGAQAHGIEAKQSCDQYTGQHTASLKQAVSHINKKKYAHALPLLENSLESLFYYKIKGCPNDNSNNNYDRVIKKTVKLYESVKKK
jgi:ankyrin repeat protein